MEQRKLGSQGLAVSAEGLGCMGMTAVYGAADEAESIATIHRALELGVTMLDTAEGYGPFLNERLIAKAIAGRRDKVILATKTGIEVSDDGAFVGLNGSSAYVEKALDRSLKNLGTDYVDLYYLHRLDPKVPVEETVGAMKNLVDSGKVRFIGLSEVSAATIRRAHAIHPLSAVQTEYSLFERGVENDGVLETLRDLKIGFVAYSPIGRGFLSGEIRSPNDFAEGDWRSTDPRFQGENFERNLAVVTEVQRLAVRKGITPSQLAIAWVLHQGVVAIPGTKRRQYLEENVAAAQVKLSLDEIAAIEKVAPRGIASGERYSSAAMEMIDK